MSSTSVEQDIRPGAAQPAPRDLYRLVVIRKSGAEILVANERKPFTLPCVEILRWERAAENLIEAVRKRYGISTICLFTPERSGTSTHKESPLYQVMETRESKTAVPNEMRYLRLDSISDQSFADERDLSAVTRAFRQIAEFQTEKVLRPFGRPRWIEQLSSWVQHEIEPYGLHLTGNFRQLNASPTFSLIRLETNAQALWFKAVGEPNVREFGISLALSKLFPGFVPTVIARHPAWHGWLSTEFPGSTLDKAPDSSAWERAARTLAELQIISVEHADQLLDAGCRDLRVPSLLTWVDPFIEVMSQVMEQQQKTPPAILSRKDLHTLGGQIEGMLSAWAELNIPDTLGHLDFNPGNILCSAEECVFLDWAEGYVGPPFFTFEYLFAHLERLQGENTLFARSVAQQYETKWRQILSPRTVVAALRLSTVLAVFAYAVGTQAWQDAISPPELGTGAYFRSLTRRMHREMQLLQRRSALC